MELSVMGQWYQAVLAVVQDGWKLTEVAERLGVSRQSVHAWMARYPQGGLAALHYWRVTANEASSSSAAAVSAGVHTQRSSSSVKVTT